MSIFKRIHYFVSAIFFIAASATAQETSSTIGNESVLTDYSNARISEIIEMVPPLAEEGKVQETFEALDALIGKSSSEIDSGSVNGFNVLYFAGKFGRTSIQESGIEETREFDIQAFNWLRQAREIYEEGGIEGPIRPSWTVVNTYYYAGDLMESFASSWEREGYYRKAIDTNALLGNQNTETQYHMLVTAGDLSVNSNRYEAAKSYYDRALRVLQEIVGRDGNSALAFRLSIKMKNNAMEMNDIISATSYYEEARRYLAINASTDSEVYGDFLGNLGFFYYEEDISSAKGDEYIDEALSILSTVGGEIYGEFLGSVGVLYYQEGVFTEKSEDYLSQAVAVLTETLGASHERTLVHAGNLEFVRGGNN